MYIDNGPRKKKEKEERTNLDDLVLLNKTIYWVRVVMKNLNIYTI